MTYPQILLQEIGKKVIESVTNFDGDGGVEGRLFWDVPAVGTPNDSHAVSFHVKLFHQDLHVDPVTAVHWEHQNVSSVTDRCEESQTHAEENKHPTGTTQRHSF